jgi:hypothetical protein
MTHRKTTIIALVILASCAKEATVREVPASPRSADTILSGSASSTVSAIDTSNQAADSLVGDADDESSPPIDDSTAFSCTPKSFGPRDTLTFRMETPHGGEMSVRIPDNTTYGFVNAQPSEGRPNYSGVSSEAFKTMGTLKVPADIRMPPEVYGRDTAEVVFAQPGQYVVAMGVNLHSDHTDPPYICKLTFSPR